MGIIPVDNNKGNSVASVDTVDFSQFTNPAANAEKGLAMAEAMDFDFGEIVKASEELFKPILYYKKNEKSPYLHLLHIASFPRNFLH